MADEPVAQAVRPRRSQLVAHAERAMGATILYLALPVLSEQLLTSFVGLVDTFIAGRLSRAATIAVGLASYVNWFGMLLSNLVTAGTLALVARHWGAAEEAQANRVLNHSLPLAAVAGILLTVTFYTMAPWFAWLQGLEGDAYEITVQYLRITSFALPFTSTLLVAVAALRGAGDMKTPLAVNALVNLINVVASWLLTFGLAGYVPGIGVAGIAVGTLAARISGWTVLTVLMSSGVLRLRVLWSGWRWESRLVRTVLRIGLPAAGDGIVMWAGQFAFLTVIGHLAEGALGEAYFAAHVVGIRVESLTYLPAVAWGAAGATLVGQFLGAGSVHRARQAGNLAALQGATLGTFCGIGYFLFAEPLYRLMHRDPLVWEVGIPAFRMLAWFQPLLVAAIVYIGCLRGGGQTKVPLAITTTGVLGLRLPLAYTGGVLLGRGLVGAWAGMCADITVRAAIAWWAFQRQRWQRLTEAEGAELTGGPEPVE